MQWLFKGSQYVSNVELLGSLEKYFICKMKMLFFMNELIVN
jgi:hypothetical protein